MMDDIGPASLAPELIEEARGRARAALGRGRTIRAVAEESGIAYATLSAFLAGTYAGRNDRVADKLRLWHASQETASRTRSHMPAPPAFVATPTGLSILETLEFAQHAPDMVTVTGAPGIGKTMACEAHAAGSPNVWIVTGEPCLTTPRQLLVEIAEQVGVATLARGTSGQRLSSTLVRRLRGTRGLIVLDEAQHLSTQALDQLRTLHDKAGIGIALVGNEAVAGRVEGTARDPHFAQLFSRIGMRLKRKRPLKRDVQMLMEAWGIADAATVQLALDIAGKPGALRGLTKALRIAHMHAAGAGDQAVTPQRLEAAWRQISDERDHTGNREAAAAAGAL